MAGIVFKNVDKIYDGNVHAVKNLNLEIQDGEFLILVGPSGCGKSTTLRMIAGLEEISSGEIYIDEKLINDVPAKDRDIAMVFQNYALYPHMTVFENMSFALKLAKANKGEIKTRVEEVSKILNIEDLLNRRPKELSGGQRQRVALGRAMVRDPKIFLLDEPLSNLDAKLRAQTRTEITKLHNDLKTTFVYVTHDQIEAMTMGDRIVVMKDGLVQQVDTPTNLYNRPNNVFVAGFIGTPQINLLNGNVLKILDKYYINIEGVNFEIHEKLYKREILDTYIGKEILCGIRPEDIIIDFNENREGLKANIELVEMMGSENYVYMVMENKKLISRTSADKICRPNMKVNLDFNMAKVNLFDMETENLIEKYV